MSDHVDEPTELDLVYNDLWNAKVRIEALEAALRAIMKATVEGRVCNDVAWFDSITTLHDYCAFALTPEQEK
jgi:hypothetical protein